MSEQFRSEYTVRNCGKSNILTPIQKVHFRQPIWLNNLILTFGLLQTTMNMAFRYPIVGDNSYVPLRMIKIQLQNVDRGTCKLNCTEVCGEILPQNCKYSTD